MLTRITCLQSWSSRLTQESRKTRMTFNSIHLPLLLKTRLEFRSYLVYLIHDEEEEVILQILWIFDLFHLAGGNHITQASSSIHVIFRYCNPFALVSFHIKSANALYLTEILFVSSFSYKETSNNCLT